jgi:hypothetical protein
MKLALQEDIFRCKHQTGGGVNYLHGLARCSEGVGENVPVKRQ